MSWRIFQISKFSWMFPRATENAVVGPHTTLFAYPCTRELFKPWKALAGLLVCNDRNILGFNFFVSDIISGVGLGLIGQGYWVLVPNHMREVFCSSFQRKLGWNPSLMSLWLAFKGLWFKRYGQKKLNLGKNYWKSFIYPNFDYFVLTFEPETLESQSNAQIQA